MIKRGDRVRITDHGADVLNDNMHPGRLDWHNRRGCVHHLRMFEPRNQRRIAYVLWDGRKSLNWVPLDYLEEEPSCPV